MGFMIGNGNIARLRSGASVERRKIVASTVAQAFRRSLRFLLGINRFAYFAYFAVPTPAAITALDSPFTAATNSNTIVPRRVLPPAQSPDDPREVPMSKTMSLTQLNANRRTARQSTGPKSAAGQKIPRPAGDGHFRPGLNHENYQTNPNANFDFPQ